MISPSFQPILKSKSKMAESKMAKFLEIAIFQPIQVQFVSNLKLKFSFQPKMAESKMAESKMAESKMAESN